MSKTNSVLKNWKKSLSNGLRSVGQTLSKNGSTISTICLTSIFFLAVIFWMKISSTADQLETLGNNYELQIKNKNQEMIISQQSSYLNQAKAIIDLQNKQLQEADDIIKKQREILEKTFQRLKELNGWDPDKITRSEA